MLRRVGRLRGPRLRCSHRPTRRLSAAAPTEGPLATLAERVSAGDLRHDLRQLAAAVELQRIHGGLEAYCDARGTYLSELAAWHDEADETPASRPVSAAISASSTSTTARCAPARRSLVSTSQAGRVHGGLKDTSANKRASLIYCTYAMGNNMEKTTKIQYFWF